MLGRRGPAGLDLGGGHREGLALGQVLRLGPCLGVLCLRVHLPARRQDLFPFGGVGDSAAHRRDAGLRRAAGWADGPQQTQGNQPQHLPLPNGQGLQVHFPRAGCGDDGVVVADLGAVADRTGQRYLRRVHAAEGGGHSGQRRNHGLHIVRQIPAVCPGVGAELLFIEGLQVVQRLLGGVAQRPVGLPLEGGQVIEGGGLLRFLPPRHRLNYGGGALAPGSGLLGLLLAGRPLSGEGDAAAVQLHRVEGLRLESGDLRLPLDNEGQGG